MADLPSKERATATIASMRSILDRLEPLYCNELRLPADAARNLLAYISELERPAGETSCVGCAQGWDCHPGYPNSEKRVHTPPRFIDCTAVKTSCSTDVPHVMPTVEKPPQ